MPLPLARLPSLDLIRGFVAVGRRMSITQAAEDLCLTQSAVSRQIRSLEDALAVKLLERGHRAIAFTPAGERLFRCADDVVQDLQNVLGAIGTGRGRRQPVTITASVGVAGLWLLPRLTAFQQTHSGIEIRLAADNRILDLNAENIDLAIRYCERTAAPKGAIWLFGETVVPVAHPALGKQHLRSAADLTGEYLLEYDEPRLPGLQWGEWLRAMGWENSRPRGMQRFNQYDQLMQATASGQGIAIGRLELIQPLLAEGRLRVLAAPRRLADTGFAYWLLQADAEPRAEVRQVSEWILAEARATMVEV
ncbi:MAG: LysR substrate-binding domain-containing protein [Candidatus Contendobacter sp.]|nr:LysR substrate-binding domain-containing protein [Candidatus Contendobacter sp.]MDG4558635.1 LysR substrate-binding domain-containing protein [Candidatus Contendobacter sp.]